MTSDRLAGFDPAGPARRQAGIARLLLVGVGLLAVYFAAVSVGASTDDTYWRVWTWIEAATGLAALVAAARYWRRLTVSDVILGLTLGALVGVIGAARLSLGGTPPWYEAAATALVFVGARALLPNDQGVRVALLADGPVLALRALGLGVLLGLPLAVLNVLYFVLTGPGDGWQPVLLQAAAALRPAVLEEVVFRFFVINLCVALAGDKLPRRVLLIGTMILATVPHALYHGAGGLVHNTFGYLAFSLVLALVFGLPMAYVQWRRGLEAAIGLHWVIDFVRFWVGY